MTKDIPSGRVMVRLLLNVKQAAAERANTAPLYPADGLLCAEPLRLIKDPNINTYGESD